jgi:HB1, ASXL, restriction endonuclease HTH domain
MSTFDMTARKRKRTMTPRKRTSAREKTLDIIERIISTSNIMTGTAGLSVKEIIQLAGDELPTRSNTPDNSVSRDLALDIKQRGDASRFVRTQPGRFGLRARENS